MKKYNKPEIETLALDTIDVIAVSGSDAASTAMQDMEAWKNNYNGVEVQVYNENLKNMTSTYTW